MNKTNNQAKYNQDSEIKNKLTVTRERGRVITGKKGKGHQGSMYKGHMDKAKVGKD